MAYKIFVREMYKGTDGIIVMLEVWAHSLPIVVGCSMKTPTGEIIHVPHRVIVKEGLVLWRFERDIDLHNQITFALWENDEFKLWLHGTGWHSFSFESWSEIPVGDHYRDLDRNWAKPYNAIFADNLKQNPHKDISAKSNISISEMYKGSDGIIVMLDITSQGFPLVVGCSMKTPTGKIIDIHHRVINDNGTVLWRLDHDIDTANEIIFALWKDDTFQHRICDTGWRPFEFVDWIEIPVGAHYPDLNQNWAEPYNGED